MKSLLAVPLLLVALAGTAASCGGEGEATRTVTVAPATSTDQAAAPEETTTEELGPSAEEIAVAETCLREVRPLVERLDDVNGRLAISVTYQEYRRALGRVSTAYNGMNLDALEFECISGGGVPAEKALNAHIKAEDLWGDCIDDFGCDIDSIDPRLQRHWRTASRQTDRANNYLNELETVVGGGS